jgi:hypothetical protein
MKKGLLFSYAFFAMIILFSLSACEKDNTNSASATATATIMGTVKAPLDLYTAGDSVSPIPTTVYLYAIYSSKDLVTYPSSTATYANIVKKITPDGNGNYTFKVDANPNGKPVTVTITGDDFSANQADINNKAVLKTFTLAPITVKLTKDQVRYIYPRYAAN